jgi:hypothetical protein
MSVYSQTISENREALEIINFFSGINVWDLEENTLHDFIILNKENEFQGIVSEETEQTRSQNLLTGTLKSGERKQYTYFML